MAERQARKPDNKHRNRLARTKKELDAEKPKKRRKASVLAVRVKRTIHQPKKTVNQPKAEKTEAEKPLPVNNIPTQETAVPASRRVESRRDPERIEREKRFIIWSGVTFFMLLIVFFWFLNLGHPFRVAETVKDDDFSKTWQELSDDLVGRMEEMQTDLTRINELKDTLLQGRTATTTGTSTVSGLPESDPIATSTFKAAIMATSSEIKANIGKLKEVLENE